jgi:predicted patatin/cPLA2 family phospholipase
MYERKKKRSTAKEEEDASCENNSTKTKTKHDKIALVVEGGGMRGCVSAGMVCAIHCLGLEDTIDIVYGSSAGAVIAAYFVSKQLPYYGPEVYYDSLTTLSSTTSTSRSGTKSTAKKRKQEPRTRSSKRNNNNVIDQYENNYFMDYKRITRSMGLGLCDPRLLKDVIKRPIQGKPMMNLQYMFTNVMQDIKAIDFDTFNKRQSIQPLKVVSTSLISEQPVVLSKESGHFNSIQDLCSSLHASCLLPGIAGPVMNVLKNPPTKDNNNNQQQQQQQPLPTFVLRNNNQNNDKSNNDTKNENINLLYEPLGDAMLSEPIPYDVAEKDGNATHILVIRSSSDGTNLIASDTIIKFMGSLIYRRYFLKKNNLPNMYQRLQKQQKHQRIYAKNILELNEYASPKESKSKLDKQKPSVMTIALSPNTTEVSHLETSREGIFMGVRQGFARAYDALVEDPLKRGHGAEMALKYFPDEILDYNPNDIRNTNDPDSSSSLFKSAFEQYIESTGIVPETWQQQEDETKKNEKENNKKQRQLSSERLKRSIIRYYDQCTINDTR